MEASVWRRSGAVAGILFVVALVLSVVLPSGSPNPDKALPKVVSWYTHHRAVPLTSAMLGAVASVLFFWFLAELRRAVVGQSPVFDRLRDVLLIAGVSAATLGAINAIPLAALAVTINRPGLQMDEGTIRVLLDMNGLLIGPLTVVLSLFVLSLGLLALRRAIAAPWVGWVAVASSVLSLIGGIAMFYPQRSGKYGALGVLGFVGLLLFLISVLATSILLLTDRRAAPAV